MTENHPSSSHDAAAVMTVPDAVRLEDKDCPLGCVRNDEFVLSGHDRLFNLPGEFSVVKCKVCGLMRTNPRPSADSIGFYYPDDYGPYLGTQVVEAKPSGALKRALKPWINRIFDDKTQSMPELKPSSMLEIGCASGSFLHKMTGEGWQVNGIEFSAKAAQAAIKLGYKVHVGALEDAPPPSEKYGLIVGWMVLEHLHQPVACLKKLHGWAYPEARLVLSVPNAHSLEFNIFKNHWYALQVPTHLHHFTPRTLKQILSAGGWELEEVHHQRTLTNALLSSAYLADSNGWHGTAGMLNAIAFRGGLLFYALFPLAWLFGVTGQTGRMTVWARKSRNPDQVNSKTAAVEATK